MQITRARVLASILWLLAATYACWASATYVFTTIDYPGATYTDPRGINDNGQLVGIAQIGSGGSFFGFVYSRGVFAPLPPPSAGLAAVALGINDAGVIVGSVTPAATGAPTQGFILSGGTYSLFSQPGWTNTEARGINSAGLVSGWSYNATNAEGFVYNPATQIFTDIVGTTLAGTPQPVTLAQGINTAGQVVGSSSPGFDASGAPVTPTGFLYNPPAGGVGAGTVTAFDVAGVHTKARGINDLGLITGVAGGSIQEAFVGTSAGFQLLNVPGAVNGSAASAINNAGQVVGIWGDAANDTQGFLATPASLPTGITSGGAYVFSVQGVVPNAPIFIDPLVAIGYDYAIGAGDPFFASVTLPIGIGDSLYTLSFDGMTFSLAGGVMFDFTNYFPGGVDAFDVTGIEPSAGLDPANPQAFPTELTFVGSGEFTGTMTPITAQAPEPATLALLGIGLAGLGFSRRKK